MATRAQRQPRFDASGFETRQINPHFVEEARARLAAASQAPTPLPVAAVAAPPRPETEAQRFSREYAEGARSAAIILGKSVPESAEPAAQSALSSVPTFGGTPTERAKAEQEYREGRTAALRLLGKTG